MKKKLKIITSQSDSEKRKYHTTRFIYNIFISRNLWMAAIELLCDRGEGCEGTIEGEKKDKS